MSDDQTRRGDGPVPSPDVSLTQDDSFTATSHKGLDYPLGDFVPGVGQIHRIADGISWARIPMPGSLGHINTWLLDDGEGVAVVDTGLMLSMCSDAWKAIFADGLGGRAITRVICTHLHPDHIGLAGWLCKKFDVALWMTRGEWLTARMFTSEKHSGLPPEAIAMSRAAGWSEAQIEDSRADGFGKFAEVVFEMPKSYRRIKHGDLLSFGDQQWEVVVGSGHSPEHACLLNRTSGVLVAGDQILPRISSNVSVNISEPEADPLDEWLTSIDRLLDLPADLLVCPAHGEPFYGIHTRLTALRDEHHDRLDRLTEFSQTPRRAVDCFKLLFNREIAGANNHLATGEAMAHLRYLENKGRVGRDVIDGVYWYHAA